MKLCPEPGQDYAVAAAMMAAGYQFLKLSWAADDSAGVNNLRRVVWLFQLPQLAAPPLGMIGDADAFGENDAAADDDDGEASDDDDDTAAGVRAQQQRAASTGTDVTTPASAHGSSAGNMASASVSAHALLRPITPSNMLSAQSFVSVDTAANSIQCITRTH